MSPSPAPLSTPSSPTASLTIPKIHSYHCLCSTLVLATPYILSNLPRRLPPAKDQALILPLPPLSSSYRDPKHEQAEELKANQGLADEGDGVQEAKTPPNDKYLPSFLLPSLRLARKHIIVAREDGWEIRKIWRCGRCGIVIGYEIETEEKTVARGDHTKRHNQLEDLRVVYLLAEGLVETEEMINEKER